MIYARQSTAIIVTVGPVLDADGVAVTDGVVGDFKISKNGGAPAALNASATLTHRNTGHYSLSLTATDVNTVGTAEVVIDDTVNACPMKEIQVVEEAIYDALFAASANGFAGAAGASTMTFSNTSIATAAAVTTVNGLAANVITATSIASDAIAAAKIATGAITAAKFAAGAIDAAAIADGAIDAGAIAADAITAAKIADGAIDAATFAASAITATVIAADAITAAKIADGAIDAATFAAGAINAAAIAADAITAAKIADGAIDAATFAAGAINAAAIAADAITDAKVAADVTIASVTGSVGSVTGAVGSVTGAVGSVTGNVGGNVTGTIGGLTAAALKDFFDTDSATTYASAVAGSVVKEIADNAGGASLTVQDIVDGVWDEAIANHLDAGSTGEALSDAGAAGTPPTAAEVADAVWDEAQAGHVGAGSFGEIATEIASILVDTAEIGAAGAGLTAINLPDQTMNITGNLSGSVGSVTAAVTVDDSTPIDANVEQINTVPIVGDGSGTPFGVT